MRQSQRIAINTFTSWVGIFANAAVLIFLAKFLLNKLGTDQFGMFQYVLTIQGSLIFLDLGLGATLNRLISRHLAVDDVNRLNAEISFTSLLFFGMGIIAAVVLAGIGFFLPQLVPGGTTTLYKAGFVLMVCMGANIGIMFWGFAPRGVLFGKQRYDMVNIIRTVSSMLRAASIVTLFLIMASAGLVTIGLCFLVCSLFETSSLWLLAKQQYPQMKLGLRFIDKNTVRDIFAFSSYVMILGITSMLIVSIPTFLAGRFYGPEAVAYISLSVLVLNQLERIAGGFAPVLIPVAGKYGALNDTTTLRMIMVRGTKFCALMCFPMGAIAVIFSEPLFEWFKPGFGWTWALLGIMMFPLLLRTTQRVSSSVLMGAGSVKWIAFGQIISVTAIVILSWLFAVHFDMKLYGIALGSAIPIFLLSVTFQPAYACRQTGLKWLSYMSQSYSRVVLGLLPAAVAAVVLARYFYPNSLFAIITEALICILVFAGPAWCFVLTANEREQILATFRRNGDIQAKNTLVKL